MTVEELLVECLEALTYCANSRAPHREHIRTTLDTADLSDNVREALTRLDERLALHTPSNPWKFLEVVEEHKTFEREIRDLVADLNLPRYVYHGTIAGRLQSIHEEGLIPGKYKVWKGKSEQDVMVRQNSDSGVFFSFHWRVAMHQWAVIAHSQSSGPKSSIKRAPAVIRIRQDQLTLEPDLVATNSSLIVRGRVQADHAEFIIGTGTAFPQWAALRDAKRSTK